MPGHITAIIVEDEFKVRSVFIRLLAEYCREIEVIAEADNIEDAYALIKEKNPQLVFLDIEMPHGNGFELLAKFERVPFEVIFVTSYSNYAIRAIKCSALDYLLKPVVVSDLTNLIDRIKEKITLVDQARQFRELFKNLGQDEPKTLVVHSKAKTDYIPMEEILYLEADGSYSHIYTITNKYHVAKTLKEYDELLCSPSSPFVRIHKTYIVNIRHVKQVSSGENKTVLLKNGVEIEISRRRKQELTDRLARQRV